MALFTLTWSYKDVISLAIIFTCAVIYKWLKTLISGPKSKVHVHFDWKEPRRVGKTVSFRIWIDKENTGEVELRRLLSQIQVEVKQSDEVLNILKDITETVNESTMIVKFSCRRSGNCIIRVRVKGRHISGSPFVKKFIPELMDVSRSTFNRPGHTIYCTVNENKFLSLEARDRFDNICRFDDLDWNDFHFKSEITDGSQATENTFQFYPSGLRVGIKFTLCSKGIYETLVAYKGQPIPQGIFTVVAISGVENVTLNNILANNPSWTYHEAKLLAVGDEVQKKQKKIYIYVSPKQLYIRDYILRVFPIRVATFRVSHSTKVELQFTNTTDRTYTYAIYDGIQPRITVEMEETHARVVLALFSHFLQRRIGGSESFAAKQKHFYEELRASHSEMRISWIMLKISRPNLIESTLSRTKGFKGKDWCKNFTLHFEGELGIDAGGLRREWLELLCKELFQNSQSGLFSCHGNSRLVHPNPSQNRCSSWTLKHYELAGKVVGKCLFETACGDSCKQMVNGKFSRSFLSQILGLRPNYKHFEQDDPELFLGKVKFILESPDVESMELNFTDEEYSSAGKLLKVIDLVPNGSNCPVTNDNKEEYLNAIANYRLGTRVTKEIDSFLKGLHIIVPDDLLANFDENELELLMCGKSEFNLKDLKENYLDWFSPFDTQHKQILDWFWTAISNLSDDEKAKLLQFTTGSSLLPHGGFKALNPKFSVSLSSTFGHLPVAHTCINQICLSDHSTFEEFEKSLKLAIYEGSEGFAFK